MARFFNSQIVRPISTFVAEPLDLYQNKLEGMQKQQDAYQVQIAGLNKQSDALYNDVPGAINDKKRIESSVSQLREYDINDPQQRTKALQGVQQINSEFSPFGVMGARDKKKKEYDAFSKELDDRYKSNPMMKSYMTKKLREENIMNPDGTPRLDRAIGFENGVPTNTQIVPPKEFNYTDLNDELSKMLKDEQYNQTAANMGLTKEQGHEALYSYMHGNTQSLTGKKIYEDLKNRVYSNPNLVESVKADANYFLNDEAQADNIIEQALGAVSKGGAFSRTTLNKSTLEDSVEADAAKDKNKANSAIGLTSRQSEAISNAEMENPFTEMKFGKDGSIQPTMNKEYGSTAPVQFGSSVPGIGTGYNVVATGKQGIDKETTQKNIALFKSIRTQHPELKGLNDQEVAKAYTQALTSLSSESIPLQPISGVASKDIGEKLAIDKLGRSYYIQDGQGTTNTGDLKSTLKELDINEEDFDKVLKAGVAGFTQAGKTPGAYYVEVPTSSDGGNKRRVIISPDSEMESIFRTSSLLNDARKSMIPTDIKPIENRPDYIIKVIPSIKPNGTTTWKYEEQLLDESGNVIKSNPTTLTDIRKAEKDKLLKSNYLGSQVQMLKPHTTN